MAIASLNAVGTISFIRGRYRSRRCDEEAVARSSYRTRSKHNASDSDCPTSPDRGAPFVFIDHIGARRMAQEFIQQNPAFFGVHFFNMRIVIAYIQSFPTGIGMCADERMRDWWCFCNSYSVAGREPEFIRDCAQLCTRRRLSSFSCVSRARVSYAWYVLTKLVLPPDDGISTA